MAAPTPDDHDRTKPKIDGPNQTRNVRVIAKIRGGCGLTDLNTDGIPKPWISVNKQHGASSQSVTITFADKSTTRNSSSRKEAYEVDCCYDQSEESEFIFEREVKPLINDVVFDGRNATVFACGARGSGKSYLIRGTEEKPGLAMLAIAEMLQLAADNGKFFFISLYEVDQDRVFDLLDSKQPQVFVLKDGQGRTQFKGLSQVPITSVSEFQKFYGGGHNARRPIQKAGSDLPKRTHKGFILYVSSNGGEKIDNVTVSKLNFVDLAGYEDARKSFDGHNAIENVKFINRSIYSIHNVVYSLKTNEFHVPYRENKLTNMLQDSLGGTSKILMVTCLNPSFCQDSLYMITLASRSCQSTNRVVADLTKKANSSARPKLRSSHKNQIFSSVSTSVKKQIVSRVHLSGKKPNSIASELKARKLFDEPNDLKTQKVSPDFLQASSSDKVSMVETSVPEEDRLTSNFALEPVALEEGSSFSVQEDSNSASVMEVSTLEVSSTAETTTLDEDLLSRTKEDHNQIVSSIKESSMFDEGKNIDKENNSSTINEDGSPPISAQLQELSNNLKLLYSSTPLCLEMPPDDDTFHNQTSIDIMEPRTPVTSMKVNNRDIVSFRSPWETFNTRSSGVKNSLVQEYLRVLNTADKEELRKLKGIGEKRATYILELREDSPEPFKNLDDLKDIGLSEKQIKRMMKKEAGGLFD